MFPLVFRLIACVPLELKMGGFEYPKQQPIDEFPFRHVIVL